MINLIHDRRTRRRKSRRKRKAAAGVDVTISTAAELEAPAVVASSSVPTSDPPAPDKTRRELMTELDDLGVKYTARAKRDELAALLWAAQLEGGADGDGR